MIIFNLQSRIFKTILNSWLSKAPNLAHMLDDLVDSALKIYTITRNEMLPTPNKSHYAFNLRDLSNVFQGVLMVDAKKLLVGITFRFVQIDTIISRGSSIFYKCRINSKNMAVFHRSKL